MIKVSTSPELLDVWHTLLKFLPSAYSQLKLMIGRGYVGEYNVSNGAYTIDDKIYIGKNIVKFFNQNPAVLAYLLAHELGHQVLGHAHERFNLDQREADADQFSLYLCCMAGFSEIRILNACKTLDVFNLKYPAVKSRTTDPALRAVNHLMPLKKQHLFLKTLRSVSLKRGTGVEKTKVFNNEKA